MSDSSYRHSSFWAKAVLRNCSCIVLVVATIVGCEDSHPQSYPVKGQVTFDEKPVPTGWITFLSAQGGTVTASIGTDGQFEVELPAGEHRVGVSAPREITATGLDAFKEAPKPPHVPIALAQPDRTGVVITVHEQEKNTIDIPLKLPRRRRGG